jgi:hypothetical protein
MKAMNPLIVLALLVVIPTALIVLARVKAAFVFMALCVGSVLSVSVGDAALDMVQTFVRGYSTTTASFVQLGLLLIPALLTLLFLSRTVSGSKWLLNLPPAILTGLMTLYLTVPLLPPGTNHAIYGTDIWSKLDQYQALLIAVAAIFSLTQLWAGGTAARHKKKGKHAK